MKTAPRTTRPGGTYVNKVTFGQALKALVKRKKASAEASARSRDTPKRKGSPKLPELSILKEPAA